MPVCCSVEARRFHAVSVPPCRCLRRVRNSELWDVEGRRFIDFAAGVALLNVGHCHPRVIAAAHAQLDQFTHIAFQVASAVNEPNRAHYASHL